jgi:hypothetical protein
MASLILRSKLFAKAFVLIVGNVSPYYGLQQS